MIKVSDLEQVRNNFNQAERYDLYSHFQRECGLELVKFIKPRIEGIKSQNLRVLELGAGTGNFTKLFLEEIAVDKKIDYVVSDFSEAMLERAKQKLTHESNGHISFEFCELDYHKQIDQKFDLIVSNLALQWSVDLQAVLSNLNNCLTENGVIVFSTLAENNFVQWRTACNEEHVPCALPEYPSATDLKLISIDGRHLEWLSWKFEEPVEKVKDFLKSLKETGAQGVQVGRDKMSVSQMQKVIKYFDQHFNAMTWDVMFGCFKKDINQ